LPKIASRVPGDVHPDSRAKQFSRWVQNENIMFDLYSRSVPLVRPLLERLAAVRPLVLTRTGSAVGAGAMDGSAVARGCVTLMVSVIYAHRAIPIGWLVIEGAKGHFPTETHLALVREVKARVPETATVIFLGDGEFDSPELQAALAGYDWQYVCRTAKNILIGVDEDWLSLADLAVTRGQHVFRKNVLFTRRPMARSWSLPGGRSAILTRYIWSATCPVANAPATGTANGCTHLPHVRSRCGSKPSFRTRKAGGFRSIAAI
jgi:hypothetical protein